MSQDVSHTDGTHTPPRDDNDLESSLAAPRLGASDTQDDDRADPLTMTTDDADALVPSDHLVSRPSVAPQEVNAPRDAAVQPGEQLRDPTLAEQEFALFQHALKQQQRFENGDLDMLQQSDQREGTLPVKRPHEFHTPKPTSALELQTSESWKSSYAFAAAAAAAATVSYSQGQARSSVDPNYTPVWVPPPRADSFMLDSDSWSQRTSQLPGEATGVRMQDSNRPTDDRSDPLRALALKIIRASGLYADEAGMLQGSGVHGQGPKEGFTEATNESAPNRKDDEAPAPLQGLQAFAGDALSSFQALLASRRPLENSAVLPQLGEPLTVPTAPEGSASGIREPAPSALELVVETTGEVQPMATTPRGSNIAISASESSTSTRTRSLSLQSSKEVPKPPKTEGGAQRSAVESHFDKVLNELQARFPPYLIDFVRSFDRLQLLQRDPTGAELRKHLVQEHNERRKQLMEESPWWSKPPSKPAITVEESHIVDVDADAEGRERAPSLDAGTRGHDKSNNSNQVPVAETPQPNVGGGKGFFSSVTSRLFRAASNLQEAVRRRRRSATDTAKPSPAEVRPVQQPREESPKSELNEAMRVAARRACCLEVVAEALPEPTLQAFLFPETTTEPTVEFGLDRSNLSSFLNSIPKSPLMPQDAFPPPIHRRESQQMDPTDLANTLKHLDRAVLEHLVIPSNLDFPEGLQYRITVIDEFSSPELAAAHPLTKTTYMERFVTAQNQKSSSIHDDESIHDPEQFSSRLTPSAAAVVSHGHPLSSLLNSPRDSSPSSLNSVVLSSTSTSPTASSSALTLLSDASSPGKVVVYDLAPLLRNCIGKVEGHLSAAALLLRIPPNLQFEALLRAKHGLEVASAQCVRAVEGIVALSDNSRNFLNQAAKALRAAARFPQVTQLTQLQQCFDLLCASRIEQWRSALTALRSHVSELTATIDDLYSGAKLDDLAAAKATFPAAAIAETGWANSRDLEQNRRALEESLRHKVTEYLKASRDASEEEKLSRKQRVLQALQQCQEFYSQEVEDIVPRDEVFKEKDVLTPEDREALEAASLLSPPNQVEDEGAALDLVRAESAGHSSIRIVRRPRRSTDPCMGPQQQLARLIFDDRYPVAQSIHKWIDHISNTYACLAVESLNQYWRDCWNRALRFVLRLRSLAKYRSQERPHSPVTGIAPSEEIVIAYRAIVQPYIEPVASSLPQTFISELASKLIRELHIPDEHHSYLNLLLERAIFPKIWQYVTPTYITNPRVLGIAAAAEGLVFPLEELALGLVDEERRAKEISEKKLAADLLATGLVLDASSESLQNAFSNTGPSDTIVPADSLIGTVQLLESLARHRLAGSTSSTSSSTQVEVSLDSLSTPYAIVPVTVMSSESSASAASDQLNSMFSSGVPGRDPQQDTLDSTPPPRQHSGKLIPDDVFTTNWGLGDLITSNKTLLLPLRLPLLPHTEMASTLQTGKMSASTNAILRQLECVSTVYSCSGPESIFVTFASQQRWLRTVDPGLLGVPPHLANPTQRASGGFYQPPQLPFSTAVEFLER